jgi:hypothetical protein
VGWCGYMQKESVKRGVWFYSCGRIAGTVDPVSSARTRP